MKTFFLAIFILFTPVLLFANGEKEPVQATNSESVYLEVGYMPILPVAQVFLVEEWAEEAGLNLEMIRFSDGPSMVQAVASGRLDVMYFGIGPAMVASSKGFPIRVVASAVVEQIAFIAHSELAQYYDEQNPEKMFGAFFQNMGRLPRIGTFPPGSVPSVVLNYWLQQIGVDPSELEVISMGANQVQQALLSKAVDGASILEPILTIVSETTDASILLLASQMFPNQPGAVVAVRQNIIDAHPQAVATLVALHERATKILSDDPDSAVPQVVKYLGEGLVDPELIRKSLNSNSSNYSSNPHEILDSSKVMYEFQKQTGSITGDIDFTVLFNTSFYDQLD